MKEREKMTGRGDEGDTMLVGSRERKIKEGGERERGRRERDRDRDRQTETE